VRGLIPGPGQVETPGHGADHGLIRGGSPQHEIFTHRGPKDLEIGILDYETADAP
jgi:hypothetical protein